MYDNGKMKWKLPNIIDGDQQVLLSNLEKQKNNRCMQSSFS